MNSNPSPTEPSGRKRNGQFTHGNKLAVGNPHAKRVNELRAMLLAEVTQDDLAQIVRALIEQAKSGDLAATREVLDRCLGKSASFVELRTIDRQDNDPLDAIFD